jgi:hypothetical protein
MAVLTKCVAVAYFGSPAAHKMDFVLGHRCYLGVPLADKLGVLVDLVRFHVVEDNGVDIFPPRKDLGEATLQVLFEIPSLGSAVDERRQRTAFLLAAFLGLTGFSCRRVSIQVA